MVHENLRDLQAQAIYLTNACGEATGHGTIELTEADFAKVPFEDGPGYVLPYIVEIDDRAYVLGNLEIAFADEFWDQDASKFKPESEVRAYCEAACEYIRRRLDGTHGGILLPIDEGMPGRFVIGVAIPLDGLADRGATSKALAQVFGVAADLPDLPFVDEPSAAQTSAEPGAEVDKTVATVDITPSWIEWGNLYRRLAESGEARAIKALRSDFAKAMAAAEAMHALLPTLSDEQQKIVSEVLTREIGKQGY